MKIGINASFIRKPSTGIGQFSINFLRKLMELTTHNSQLTTHFFVYLEKEADLDLPSNFTKRIFLPWWKRDDLIRKIWWEKYLLPKKVKKDKCDIFLSLYQCPMVSCHSERSEESRINNAGGFTSGSLPRRQADFTPLHSVQDDSVFHIMVVHDIIPKLFPEYLNNFRKKIYWKMTEKAIKKADKIIAISEHTKKDLIKYLKIEERKISVNHIDVDEIYKREISEEESRKVLEKYNLKPGYIYSGGGLEARKNVENLLKAYKLLTRKFPISNFQFPNKLQVPPLVISGKLMSELAPLVTDVEKLVEDLGLQNKVKLLDFVPQEDLPALYKNASVFIYPSLYEGFGLPVLEAMNCGTPVITSNVSSLPEIGGDSVLYVDPENIQDMAEKIKKVLLDSNLQKELSEKGKERAGDFSWDEFVEKILEIMKNETQK